MLFTTTQQQEEIRKKVREFAETEIKPIAFMLDKENEFPSEAIAKFGKMGLMGIPYPKEYGGAIRFKSMRKAPRSLWPRSLSC